jgi:hypothetical protein
MTHIFDKYFRRHGYYPRIRLPNGAQKMTVEFSRGYVRVTTSPPFGGEVYILASTMRRLLKNPNFLGLIRRQEEDFDVPAAVHANFLAEQELRQALREEKKTRQIDLRPREEQRQRYLRAKARAARKQADG